MTKSILSILEHIGSDTKRTHKLSVLTKYKDNLTLQRVIKMALDPYLNFYIKKIPKYISVPITDGYAYMPLETALDKLGALSNREVTGHAAINHLTSLLSSVSPDDAVVISRIIGRDLRCGIADATVNAVFKNLVPTYPCLLARPYSAENAAAIKFPAYSQLKADGVRTNALVNDGRIDICSRSGRAIDLLGALDGALHELQKLYGGPLFLDGELVVVDASGNPIDRKTGNGVIGKAIKGTLTAIEAKFIRFQVWDAFPLSEFYSGVSSKPYKERFEALEKLLAGYSGHEISLIPSKVVQNWDEAEAHFQQMLDSGEEGVIVKNYSGIWRDTRSEDLIKMKAELDADLEVVGFNGGTGQFEGMVGSLICRSSDGKVEVSISGFSIELRQWITDNINSLIGTIVTVMYNERISSKGNNRAGVDSLFLPRFKEFRTDKKIANSSSEIK